ncbi:MAG: two-component regulator propeller domain-containing protein, partial [Bacteroidota bacterium]|nr:two-component regulator propeller domain-containing protein [Bacteroidota bacterium]
MALSRKILDCIFFVFLCYSSISGQKILTPVLNSFQGKFIHYPINEPGADISTTRLFFDSKGFLWEGTGNALYRFDGNNYLTYGFRNLDSTSLSGQFVSSIYEDKEGIMWIGTYGALNRLDPGTGLIRQFMPDSANFMNNDNRIRLILEDSSVTMWILTCGRIFSFDRKTCRFTKYLPECSYSSSSWVNNPGQFLEDSKGRLWVVGKKGLSVRLRGNNKFISYTCDPSKPGGLKSDRVSCVAEDKSGIIWCSTIGGGLHRITDPEHGVIEKVNFRDAEKINRKLDTIMTILPDDNGTLWLFGNGIFANYSSGTGEIKSWPIRPMNNLFNNVKGQQMLLEEAFQDNKGYIWILQRQGIILRFNPETEELLVYNVPNWIILDWKTDSHGSIWFGCANGDTWRLMLKSLPYQTVWVNNMFNVATWDNPRMTEDPSGRLWLALSTGIYREEAPDPGKNFTPEQIRLPVADTVADCIIKDHSGNIWLSLKDSRVLMLNTDRGTHRIYHLPEKTAVEIYKIVEDSRGNLWFLSFNKIFILPPASERISQLITKNEVVDSILKEGIYDMLPDSRGNLWFASFSNGVYVYNIEQRSVTRYTTEMGTDLLAGDFCLRIKEDKQGRIWILFNNNGLYVFNPLTSKLDTVRLMTETPAGLNYFELFIDHTNRLFIDHNYGLTIYDPDKKTLRQVGFSQQVGSYCTCELPSGYLLNLAGSELKLFPDTIPSNHSIPEVYLTGLQINGNDFHRVFPGAGDLTSLKQIRLKHNQNDLKIDFSALNYLYPSNNRYRYIMTGIDKDTVLLSSYHSVEYKKLHPGKYKFWFTGSNNDGVWNSKGKSIDIRISPPVTKSALAYVLYGTLFIIIASALVVRRYTRLIADRKRLEKEVQLRTLELEKKNRQIEQLDKMKTNFFTEISHELRTPLSLILGPIDNLIANQDKIDSTKRYELMEVIKRNSSRLLNLINQLLDISRIDAGKMKITLSESDLLKTLRILVNEFLSTAESRKIKFDIQVPDGSYITFFDTDKVEKIVINILSNAFKFTPAYGTIICKVEILESAVGANGTPPVLSVMVKDTGVGISKENIDRIFDRFYRVEGEWEKDGMGTGIGLPLTREFVALLHGHIEVSSEKDVGSTFTVKMPVGKTHLSSDEYVIASNHQVSNGDANLEPNIQAIGTEKGSDPTGKKPQLLIVEDNDDLRGFIKDNLSQDYQIFEAADGKSGLKISLTKIPDLIIADIIIPNINVIELCRKLKNDERTSHIP